MKTNWEEIRQKYITSDVSCKKLANEFGLSERTVQARATRDKWQEERSKFVQKCAKNFEEEVLPALQEIYKETATLAANELKEEVEQTIRIRKSIDEQEEDKPEKRVRYCAANIALMLDTLEKHAYPEREQETNDNNITVVLGDEKLKEYIK